MWLTEPPSDILKINKSLGIYKLLWVVTAPPWEYSEVLPV